MTKETLKKEGIQHDLKRYAEQQYSHKSEARLIIAVPLTFFAVMIVIFFKFTTIPILLASLIMLVAIYHYVFHFIEWKSYRAQKKMIFDAIDREDFSISVQKLSHIATEIVHEPYAHVRPFLHTHAHAAKEIANFYFEGGDSWRMPSLTNPTAARPTFRHYAWSKEFHLSTEGLLNISIKGNEFYYVTLQREHEISYVYPCKLFTLDTSLKQ